MARLLIVVLAVTNLTGAGALTVKASTPPCENNPPALKAAPIEGNTVLASKIRDLDLGFPSRAAGACPHVQGQPYKGKTDVTTVEEVNYCTGLLKTAEQSGECLIYNFGVGKDDEVLRHFAQGYPKCNIFAFDPTVNETMWEGGAAQMFGPNVQFFSWGLFGGNGPQHEEWTHPKYGSVQGTLYNLQQIMEKLGHSGKRINLFRSDCEGCEWDWVDKSMKDDPNLFQRIDQMFTELHFSTTLRFDDPALQKVPSMHKMLANNFAVTSWRQNRGYDEDQCQVPQQLVQLGVGPRHCCREYFFVNLKASDPVAAALPMHEDLLGVSSQTLWIILYVSGISLSMVGLWLLWKAHVQRSAKSKGIETSETSPLVTHGQ